jgi:nucleotide-binding universal stress UspA family protein
MNMQPTIVTATDFSAPSRHAAQRAALLARSSGATLTLMHTVGGSALDDLRRWLADDSQAAGAIEADARQRLQELAAELAAGTASRPTHLSIGHPVEQVIRHADEVDAGLLVTGTRGAGFFRGVVVGSTAERIAKRSSRPVLMVRQLPHEPYRRILVPVDFSPSGAAAPSNWPGRSRPQATLVLMHAVELPFEGKMRIAGVAEDTVSAVPRRRAARGAATPARARRRRRAGRGPRALSTPSGADPWMLIVQEEQEHDCDIVVIGRQGRHAPGNVAPLPALAALHRQRGRRAVADERPQPRVPCGPGPSRWWSRCSWPCCTRTSAPAPW